MHHTKHTQCYIVVRGGNERPGGGQTTPILCNALAWLLSGSSVGLPDLRLWLAACKSPDPNTEVQQLLNKQALYATTAGDFQYISNEESNLYGSHMMPQRMFKPLSCMLLHIGSRKLNA